MPSKMVTDRQKNAAVLSAALKKHAAQTTQRFTHLVEPHLREGEQVPDLIFLHELLQRRLGAVRQQLVEVDDLLQREQEEDSRAREQRDQAAGELTSFLVRFRFTVKGVCGADRCGRVLGADGSVPKDPVVLQRMAHNAVDRLREGTLDSPDAALGGVAIDSAAWIGMLEEPLQRLDQALAHLSEESQDTYDHHATKNALMAKYDKAYLSCARLLENLFRHVGMDELAGRVRPTQRSPTASAPDGEAPRIPEDSSPPGDPQALAEVPAPESSPAKSLASLIRSALS